MITLEERDFSSNTSDNAEDKIVLSAANCLEQKFFIEPKFSKLPDTIKEELQVICVTLAEKLGCIFMIGFYVADGEIYFETVQYDDDLNFDYIGSELEIKRIVKQHKELINSLTLWYQVVILGTVDVEI